MMFIAPRLFPAKDDSKVLCDAITLLAVQYASSQACGLGRELSPPPPGASSVHVNLLGTAEVCMMSDLQANLLN